MVLLGELAFSSMRNFIARSNAAVSGFLLIMELRVWSRKEAVWVIIKFMDSFCHWPRVNSMGVLSFRVLRGRAML